MLAGARAPETVHEYALAFALHGTQPPDEADVTDATLDAVVAALASYDVPAVRMLFDACLLGKALPEELAQAFNVSPAEVEAYTTLFFDTEVFTNDFHVIAWIAQREETARATLKEAHTKGFRAIRFQYAADRSPPSVETTLTQVLEADTRAYLSLGHILPGDSRHKDVAALRKQVVTTASVLHKIANPVDAPQEASGDDEFVIKPRPPNPTLEQLVARGGQIAQ